MRLCIIYKAYYNMAMFRVLQYATSAAIHTRGHNIKFVLPHCSKDSNTPLPQAALEAATLNQFKACLPGAMNSLPPLRLILYSWQD